MFNNRKAQTESKSTIYETFICPQVNQTNGFCVARCSYLVDDIQCVNFLT